MGQPNTGLWWYSLGRAQSSAPHSCRSFDLNVHFLYVFCHYAHGHVLSPRDKETDATKASECPAYGVPVWQDTKTEVKWVWKRERSGGQCAVCYSGLISCLTKHSEMERRREQRRQIYGWASHNDTANKTTLTAATLTKHLEMCDCSSFVAAVAGQLRMTCAELTLAARRETAKHLECISVSVALNVKL